MALSDYEKLKERLLENQKWPLKYMFKFVVPNSEGRVDKVVALMPENGKTSFKHTKNLKFVSVTCVAYMKTAEEIIRITHDVASIKGVISL